MYEKRREEIISPKDGNSSMRIARFLKPNARNINQYSGIPETPFVSDIFTYQNLQKWPLKVHFINWKKPQKNWMEWVNRLVIYHGTSWIKTGIYDGIQASLHEIPCNYDLILGVCEFWCSKTSTFIFPWGEATITLEDVMILGGLPVVGEPINKAIEGNLVEIDAESKKIGKSGEKEATHSTWLKHFMEEEEEGEIEHEEGKLEHVAFLCLWLSRFVFPDLNEGIISDYVFTIAIHLSQGTPIALAHAVLAKLYQELTLLTQNAITLPLDSKHYASGLFKIVQLWVCERFPDFGAKLAKPLAVGDPRVARWDNVEIQNWEYLAFYEESEQKLSNCATLDDCLLSFGRFLCSVELNGLETDCREKYQPHRVAMQFGYDQDIPGEFKDSAIKWDKVGLYIPSRTFDPGVSRTYYNWWKDSMLRHEAAVSSLFWPKTDEDGGEIGKCNIGKSPCASPQFMLEACENKSNSSIDMDLVPLEWRLCSNAANKEALKSPQIKFNQTRASIGGLRASEDEKHQPSAPLDIDHVPFDLRLQLIAQSTKAHAKLLESYASTGNFGNPLQGENHSEEVASQKSDADSYITRKVSSIRKATEADTEAEDMSSRELLDRVAKLERAVAVLRAGKLSDAEFF
ncbi:Serine/threonine-protein phosphatase 7 long form-like protein [Bienertia sinuspersici]